MGYIHRIIRTSWVNHNNLIKKRLSFSKHEGRLSSSFWQKLLHGNRYLIPIVLYFISFAGFPPIIALISTSLVTTARAAITAWFLYKHLVLQRHQQRPKLRPNSNWLTKWKIFPSIVMSRSTSFLWNTVYRQRLFSLIVTIYFGAHGIGSYF
jgi:hypothetical protein